LRAPEPLVANIIARYLDEEAHLLAAVNPCALKWQTGPGRRPLAVKPEAVEILHTHQGARNTGDKEKACVPQQTCLQATFT
jgi:hypothetical protein